MRRLALLLATMLLGCAGPFVHVSAAPSAEPRAGGLTSGSACGMMVLGLVPIGMTDRAARAYDEAVRSAGTTGLTDTAIGTHWYFAGIGTVHCVDVDGTAVR